MIKYGLTLILLIVFLSSCSIAPAPPRRIIFINAQPELKGVHVKNMPITIDSSACSSIFDRLSVYAQTDKFELTLIPGYVWVDTPCNMVENSLVKTFSKAGFRVVDFSGNRLTFSLFEFQPVFEKNRLYCKIFAKFTLRASGKIQIMFYQRKKLMKNKSQFVDCLNTLVSDMDGAVLNWVYGILNAGR